MAVKRVFLGWDSDAGPPLERACAWLVGRGGAFNLSGLLIVTPGGRVGRLMLGMLIDRARADSMPLAPPTFCTPGEVAGSILRPPGKAAQPVQRRLAWSRAVAGAGPLAALLPHSPTDDHARLAVAAMLERCHQELIGEALRFDDVPDRHSMLEEREADRWREAAKIQRRYEAELAEAGLIDEGLSLLEALDAGRAHQQRVLLIGVPDLSEVARRVVSLPEVECESIIFAPPDHAHLFDDVGCVKVDEWADRPTPITDEGIIFADDPADQGRHFAEVLAHLGGAYSIHDITVGVPDESVAIHISRAAGRFAGVEARAAAGSPLSSSTVFQLLAAIQRLLEDDTFDALAALARQPDMERYLLRSFGQGRVERWLGTLDEYGEAHLPGRGALGASILTARTESRLQLEKLQRTVRSLVEPLAGRAPVAADVLAVMQRVYSGSSVGRDDPRAQDTIRASKAIAAAAVQMGELPESWQPRTGAELVHLLLDACQSERLPPERTADALELLGWLELPLDPAPVAIVTGVNDGMLPESFGADPLLPDSLRSRLGIASTDRRLAREIYLLSLLAHSRKELRLICGRRGAGGEPLIPSRLLFAADNQTVVRRIRRFCDSSPKARPIIVPRRFPGGRDIFPRLPGVATPVVDSMRVTSFRTFIASPYLFYLQHVLNLRERDRPQAELDPRAFGTLVHCVLQGFAASDARDSASEHRIRECLLDHLASEAAGRYGPRPSLALTVQLDMARLRLAEFAAWQAGRRAEGWSIVAWEWKPDGESAPLPGMDQPFKLRGTIDRIDEHDDGSVAILDYKTGDDVKPPQRTHRKSGEWIDLQLPLYRHLAAERRLPQDPSKLTLGYVALPSRPGGVALLKAEWSAAKLASADVAACEIASRVRRGEFFVLGDSPAEEGVFGALSGAALASGSSRAGEGGNDD
jgi:ATP-dependent helicase/nuclease subunit B